MKARGRELVICALGDTAKLSAVFAREWDSRQPEARAAPQPMSGGGLHEPIWPGANGTECDGLARAPNETSLP